MTHIDFWARVRALVKYMNNPWFKGEHAENVYFNRVHTLWNKVSGIENANYIPTPEDIFELYDLEQHKPADPFPYAHGPLYRNF